MGHFQRNPLSCPASHTLPATSALSAAVGLGCTRLRVHCAPSFRPLLPCAFFGGPFFPARAEVLEVSSKSIPLALFYSRTYSLSLLPLRSASCDAYHRKRLSTADHNLAFAQFYPLFYDAGYPYDQPGSLGTHNRPPRRPKPLSSPFAALRLAIHSIFAAIRLCLWLLTTSIRHAEGRLAVYGRTDLELLWLLSVNIAWTLVRLRSSQP